MHKHHLIFSKIFFWNRKRLGISHFNFPPGDELRAVGFFFYVFLPFCLLMYQDTGCNGMKSPKEKTQFQNDKVCFRFFQLVLISFVYEYIPRYGIFITLTWGHLKNESAMERVKSSQEKKHFSGKVLLLVNNKFIAILLSNFYYYFSTVYFKVKFLEKWIVINFLFWNNMLLSDFFIQLEIFSQIFD